MAKYLEVILTYIVRYYVRFDMHYRLCSLKADTAIITDFISTIYKKVS